MPLPILFSEYFKTAPEAFDEEGLLDPFVEVDLQLFIDPLLLAKSSNRLIASEGIAAFRKHFNQLVKLLMISEAEGDVAWRAAENLLSLREPPENGLGYDTTRRYVCSEPRPVRETRPRDFLQGVTNDVRKSKISLGDRLNAIVEPQVQDLDIRPVLGRTRADFERRAKRPEDAMAALLGTDAWSQGIQMILVSEMPTSG